ncbi:hypothetical protein PUNSTDRAFT_108433 [Punctularia strigosozonata HHB-11173 SS5]|uniref:J domain-containing protein n=1 Tax=Punctularia strigosozonata (strain HHB-11173) TaxID=741275 RepID=R7S4W4_PUNST|nr:uncharacterized protein PUNSTDRAFT_108433 [Punctularia strigosozonata HHB-11173 SS5]EIN04311.1 hypothetical protein PUNSTDRAFT_108433 [Punctularia strigosozonata HHB-11173 SS5]
MATYNYDESGSMALYFILTFLAIILVPFTISSISPSSNKQRVVTGCQCQPCLEQRERVRKREKGSSFLPNLSAKAIFLLLGWTVFGLLAWKVANTKLDNKLYDPFEILGISTGSTEKEIKSRYKKLSKQFHPDKVKLAVNETIEMVEARFVEITKAYKSLTDETIRKNWEQYGNPDGRQELSMGIALPVWVIEGKNNIWVLGLYGIVFGGALPMLVGRWWFGNRQKTKDGVNARTAAAFFKSLKEESGMEDVVSALGKAFSYEPTKAATGKKNANKELKQLEKQIEEKLGAKWLEVRKLTEVGDNVLDARRRALVLLYAHALRLPVQDSSLVAAQADVLLRTPLLLNALLTISIARNWLLPTLNVMRLHAYLAQALPPTPSSVVTPKTLKFAQLPKIEENEAKALAPTADGLEDFVTALEAKGDARAAEAKKAVEKWGKLDVVDIAFKVIGERLVTPQAIVFLVVKLRITPPGLAAASTAVKKEEEDVEDVKRRVKLNDEKDYEFLTGKRDAEPLPEGQEDTVGWAHAPYWPANRKPSWWLVLADDKMNKVVVPPMRITDVPLAKPGADRDYRSYKLQFQAPPNVGLYTWKVYFVSDTFVGEEVQRDITLKIDDLSVLSAEEQGAEDEISDPDEDTLAGQMAALRGGAVKKRTEEESDDESGTDDDEESDDDSSSSDSD